MDILSFGSSFNASSLLSLPSGSSKLSTLVYLYEIILSTGRISSHMASTTQEENDFSEAFLLTA